MIEFDTDTITLLEAAIAAGSYDDTIDSVRTRVEAAVAARKAALTAHIGVGDIVTVSDLVKPTYLAGLRAEVVKVNPKTVKVQFVDEDKTKARRFGQGRVSLPRTLVKVS